MLEYDRYAMRPHKFHSAQRRLATETASAASASRNSADNTFMAAANRPTIAERRFSLSLQTSGYAATQPPVDSSGPTPLCFICALDSQVRLQGRLMVSTAVLPYALG